MNKLRFFYNRSLHLSLLTIRRDWKRLSLSFISLAIGAMILAFIVSAQNSLGNYVQNETKALVGGDITLRLSQPLTNSDSDLFNRLQNTADRQASKTNTNTVVRANGQAVLSWVSAVSDSYPVYGEIKVSSGQWRPLQDDELVAEQNLLDRLGVSIGDQITVGDSSYTLITTLQSLPDQLTNGFNFGPRILLSDTGFTRTGIDKGSSRISYRYTLAFDDSQISSDIMQQLRTEFRPLSGRLRFASEGAGGQLRQLENITQFLVILSVLSLFLVVINIRATMSYLLLHYRRSIALYKVLGLSPFATVFIFATVIGLLSVAASFVGVIIGNSAVALALPFAEQVINAELIWSGLLFGAATVCAIILIIALLGSVSTLLSIAQIAPKEVFSAINEKRGNTGAAFQEFILALCVAVGLIIIVWLLAGNIWLSVLSVSTLSVLFLVLVAAFVLSSNSAYRVRFKLPHQARYVSNFIHARGALGLSSYAALVLALTALFSITGLEHALQKSIDSTISRETPSLYFLDVQRDQQAVLEDLVPAELNLFPNIRARLVEVDGRDIQTEFRGQGEYTREFNNTYRTELVSGESIISGTWHADTATESVSVDAEIAQTFGIELGSVIGFGVQGRVVRATVTSLRSTEETTIGLPFFYFVFSPDVISEAPQSLFGFADVDSDKIASVQNRIAETFSNISTLPTADLLDFVSQLSRLFSQVLVLMSLPALALGSLLVWSQLLAATAERIKDLGLFKILGMTKQTSIRIYAAEMFALVFGSVLFAFIISRIVSWSVLWWAFDLPLVKTVEPYAWYVALGSLAVVGIFVYYFSTTLYHTSLRNRFFK